MLRYPVVETILRNLSPNLPLPMLASVLRTLNIIMQTRPTPNILVVYPHVAPTLVHFILEKSTPPGIVDLCCKLIVHIVLDKPNGAEILVKPLIMRISDLMQRPKAALPNNAVTAAPLESALLALAHIVRKLEYTGLLRSDPIECEISSQQVDPKTFLDGIVRLTRNHDKNVRAAAVSALVDIKLLFSEDPEQIHALSKLLLPTLFPLLGVDNTDPQAYKAMVVVCRDDPGAVKTAFEAGVIGKISDVVRTADTKSWSNSELIASCLLVLVAFCMRDETYRIAVMDTKVMASVMEFMVSEVDSPIRSPGIGLRKVKLAACHLVRALARSVSLLRNGLVSEKIVDGMYDILSARPDVIVRAYEDAYGEGWLSLSDREYWLQQELDMKSGVMAAICNLVPEFSSCQKLLTQRGFLGLIADGAKSPYGPLRLNSVWALKHAVYEMEQGARAQLLSALTPEWLFQLCVDEESQIQEQALGTIRNIMCSGDLDAIDSMLSAITTIRLMTMLCDKLDSAAGALASLSPNGPRSDMSSAQIESAIAHHNQITVHIVYTIANMAMHSAALRELVLAEDELLKQIVALFEHQVDDVRSGCAWVVTNLVWHTGAASGAASGRDVLKVTALKLLKLGLETKLRRNLLDPCLHVRERTKFAVNCLQKILGPN